MARRVGVGEVELLYKADGSACRTFQGVEPQKVRKGAFAVLYGFANDPGPQMMQTKK